MALRPQPWARIAHRLFHFPGGTPRAATAPTRPPPTIICRGSSGRFSLGLRWGQRLWTDHFRVPDAQPCLEAHVCLARAQPQWGVHGRHTALVASPREAQGARVLCLLTSRLIYLLCWATKRIFKTQNSRKLSKGFGGWELWWQQDRSPAVSHPPLGTARKDPQLQVRKSTLTPTCPPKSTSWRRNASPKRFLESTYR